MEGGSSYSVTISTSVVRGLESVFDWLGETGDGLAAGRVLAGAGTVMVSVMIKVS